MLQGIQKDEGKKRSVAPYVITQREGLRKNQGDNTKQKRSKNTSRGDRELFFVPDFETEDTTPRDLGWPIFICLCF